MGGCQVDDSRYYAGKNDPNKLVPVEKWEAKKHRCGAGVDSGKQQPKGWKQQQPVPVSAARLLSRDSHVEEDCKPKAWLLRDYVSKSANKSSSGGYQRRFPLTRAKDVSLCGSWRLCPFAS